MNHRRHQRHYYTKNTSRNTAGGSTSIFTILFVVFLVLKLTNNIDWSWLWVLSPIWIPASIVVGALIIIVVVATIQEGLNASLKLGKYYIYILSLSIFLMMVFILAISL